MVPRITVRPPLTKVVSVVRIPVDRNAVLQPHADGGGDRLGMFKMIRCLALGAVLGTVLLLTGSAREECAAQGDGVTGLPPPPGGAACWDTNANGLCDPEQEDRTRDGRCDEFDCPRGPQEDPNSPPPPPPGSGSACWDSNANGTCDQAQEDHNRDGRCDEHDCPPGPPEEEYLQMLQKGAKP